MASAPERHPNESGDHLAAPLTGMTNATTPSTRRSSIDRCRTRRAPRPPTGRGRRPATPRSPHRCRRPATAGPPTATVRGAPSAPTARCRPRDAMPTPRRPATSARPRALHRVAGRRRFGAAPSPPARLAAVDPSGSATASITWVWLATSTLGTANRRAHAASASSSSDRRRAAAGTSAGERHRPFAPPQAVRVDEPAGDERRSDVVVADRGHQAVVLVAEVGRERRPVADRAGGRDRRERRHAEGPGDDVGPYVVPVARRRHPVPRARRPPLESSAQTSTWASKCFAGDHHDQTISAARSTAARTGCDVARAEDRLRQHEADAAAVGRGTVDGEGEELGGGVGVGPPPWRLAPPRVVAAASCDRYGGLPTTTSNSSSPQSRASASPTETSTVTAPPRAEQPRGGDHRLAVDVDPADLRHPPARDDVLDGGDEESAVAACRVEDPTT